MLPRELDLLQQAHFFARFGAAIADAAIACYRVKYEVLFWRPVTAIRLPDGSEGEYTVGGWVGGWVLQGQGQEGGRGCAAGCKSQGCMAVMRMLPAQTCSPVHHALVLQWP